MVALIRSKFLVMTIFPAVISGSNRANSYPIMRYAWSRIYASVNLHSHFFMVFRILVGSGKGVRVTHHNSRRRERTSTCDQRPDYARENQRREKDGEKTSKDSQSALRIYYKKEMCWKICFGCRMSRCIPCISIVSPCLQILESKGDLGHLVI